MFKKSTNPCGERRLKKKLTLIILISTLVSTVDGYSQSLEFGPVFESYLTQNIYPKVPGYAVGIITDKGAYKITAGVREKGKADLIDESTLFRLASVSKTFTPAAVIALKDSVLHFDSKIELYLPSLSLSNSEYQKSLSLRHILSQASGLFPHAYTNLIQDNVPYKKIVKKLENVDFICKPGTCYSYQNVVYSLAGDVIAQAGSSTYEKIVEEKLFHPLGMKSSSFGLAAFLAEDNRAQPHRWIKKNKHWRVTKPKENYYQLSPSAGTNTNLNDMIKWLEAQLGMHPAVLNKDELLSMHAPQIKTSRRQAHYGKKSWNGVSNYAYALGWRTFDFNGQSGFVHHGGWVEGFRVELVINQELNMGMFFVTNSEPRLASDIVPAFIRMYMDHNKAQDGMVSRL